MSVYGDFRRSGFRPKVPLPGGGLGVCLTGSPHG